MSPRSTPGVPAAAGTVVYPRRSPPSYVSLSPSSPQSLRNSTSFSWSVVVNSLSRAPLSVALASNSET